MSQERDLTPEVMHEVLNASALAGALSSVAILIGEDTSVLGVDLQPMISVIRGTYDLIGERITEITGVES